MSQLTQIVGHGTWMLPSGNGISDAANSISHGVAKAYDSWISVPSRQRAFEASMEALESISQRAAEQGWDGYDACPIPVDAYDEAARFLELLPDHYPVPEIIADPSGAITLEWYVAPNRVFTVSLHGNRSIEYAGLFAPGNEDFGRVNFASLLPPRVLEALSRLY